MKYEDLNNKTADELSGLLLDTKKKLYNSRFAILSGEPAKPHEIRANKRLVAQIQTAITAKKVEEAANA